MASFILFLESSVISFHWRLSVNFLGVETGSMQTIVLLKMRKLPLLNGLPLSNPSRFRHKGISQVRSCLIWFKLCWHLRFSLQTSFLALHLHKEPELLTLSTGALSDDFFVLQNFCRRGFSGHDLCGADLIAHSMEYTCKLHSSEAQTHAQKASKFAWWHYHTFQSCWQLPNTFHLLLKSEKNIISTSY